MSASVAARLDRIPPFRLHLERSSDETAPPSSSRFERQTEWTRTT
jgi:hypothetical protein